MFIFYKFRSWQALFVVFAVYFEIFFRKTLERQVNIESIKSNLVTFQFRGLYV